MNRIVSEQYGLFRLYQRLREQLLATLTDDDLAFTPGGANPPLGELCLEIGETERSYIDSFVNFSQSFDYRHADRSLAGSVAGLRAWYEQLDAELYSAVAALSDEEVANRPIDRGHGFMVPAEVQLHIYQEALIIFYGKATVYLKLLGKPTSEQWQHWIG
jgi:uncharacterized damage-inducible protein DinB